MSSVMIDSDLVVIVQAQLDQAALGGRSPIASEQRYAGVFFAHLQPPLVAVNQPLQPLAVHLRCLLHGAQTTAMFTSRSVR